MKPFLKSEGPRLALGAVAACALLIVVVAKCGGEKQGPIPLGHVTITVQLTVGLPIEKVGYRIEGPGSDIALRGHIMPDELARGTVAVRGIRVGKPWRVELSATSADGDISCMGSATFEVLPEQTTAVSTSPTCVSRSGATAASVPNRRCPIVQSYAVAPTQTAVGGSVELDVQTSSAARVAPLHHAWSGAGGTFADASAARTRWTCTAAGDHTLALRVWDETCTDRITLSVRCISLDCGNGRIDPEESCEPPGTPSCDLGCRKVVGCGNAQIDDGEQCDDGNAMSGDGCSATCTRESICGNGIVEAGEDCEPPGAGACNSLCGAMPPR
jgi:cysteine-rich repeat protein